MQASASKDSTKSAFPIYGAAEKISEGVLVLMQSFGIQEIECRTLRSADYERLIGEAKFFSGTPQEIIDAGMLVKDNLAAIIAASGIIRLSIAAEPSDTEQLVQSYRTLIQMAAEEAAKARAEAEGSSKVDPVDPVDSADSDAAAKDQPVEVTIPDKDSSHA